MLQSENNLDFTDSLLYIFNCSKTRQFRSLEVVILLIILYNPQKTLICEL